MPRWLPHAISLILLIVAGTYFWGTAVSTGWARLSALQTVEPYAFAVHEQLMYNFATSGEFSQTIHRGYDDSWTWSGHRAPTLPLTALLYGLHPTPLWLTQLMLLSVLLGAIPAALIGQRATGSGLGLAWGGLVYLTAPVTMVMALQDYQDLIYALPFLMFTIWAVSSGRWWLSLLGVVVAILPREECMLMGIAIAVLCPPQAARPRRRGQRRRRRWWLWAANIAVAVLVVALYTAWAQEHYPLEGQEYSMPLLSAIKSGTGASSGGRIYLEGWLYLEPFYSLLWVPLGLLALAAPALTLPAVALIGFHMTVPEGMGIDRSWSGHSHHLAPAAAFLLAAIIEGGGRLLRWIAGRSPPRGVLAASIGLLLLLWSGQSWMEWSRYYSLITGFTAQTPAWVHPVWSLVKELPETAVPIASKNSSIAISNHALAYTYDESLHTKTSGLGLGAGTHLIADTRKLDLMAWAMAMPGAAVVKEAPPFALITWNSGAQDALGEQRIKIRKGQAWTGPYRKDADIPGVPPHEQRQTIRQGSFPVITLPWGHP